VRFLTDLLKLFSDFFAHPVPLGVVAVVSILVVYLFAKLQDNRRNDYKMTYDNQERVIDELREIIKDREKRISELERMILDGKEG
jgi:predicted solute-binding protein